MMMRSVTVLAFNTNHIAVSTSVDSDLALNYYRSPWLPWRMDNGSTGGEKGYRG